MPEQIKIHYCIHYILNQKPNISKNRTNQMQGYKFRGIDDFYSTFQPLFCDAGVTLSSEILSMAREEKPTKNGGITNYVIIQVRWKFLADDGSFLTMDCIGEAMDSGDKASNKAMSASLKYALTQMFLVPTDEDNDTESTSHELAAPPRKGNLDAPKSINNPTGKINGPATQAKPPESGRGAPPAVGNKPPQRAAPTSPPGPAKPTGAPPIVGAFADFANGPRSPLPKKPEPKPVDTSFSFGPFSSEDDVP